MMDIDNVRQSLRLVPGACLLAAGGMNMKENNYEYLDHTADIQYSIVMYVNILILPCRVHAWGNDLEAAFVQTAHAMVDYMYNREVVEHKFSKELEVEGNSLNMLLYNFLEEVLFIFSCDPYMAVNSVSITEISRDSGKYVLKATCHGDEYERRKHGSKTEIKAVTFSNMRIITDNEDKVDIYIIFDI